MSSLAYVLNILLQFIMVVLIAQAIMSWLLAFNVLNYRNKFVRVVWDTTNRLTVPLLRPIRRFMPNLGGIDLSPLILILLILFIQRSLLIPLSFGQPPSIF
ncbi:MAG: YggT family protein [Rhodospirillales bacterium]|nr:MAG: YggT family protein [Rhodospirillales bacterium]